MRGLSIGVALACGLALPSTVAGAEPYGLAKLKGLERAVTAQISPSGREVAYIIERLPDDKADRTDTLWVAQIDGRKAPLKLGPVAVRIPFAPPSISWSPDGKKLTVITGDTELSLFDSATGARRSVPVPGRWVRDYKWSPDGHVIAIATAPAGDGLPLFSSADSIDWIDPATLTGPRQAFDKTSLSEITWSPDGKTLAAIANGDLVLIEQGQSPRILVKSPDTESDPSWSPDGHRIAYVAPAGDEERSPFLRIVDVATGAQSTPNADVDFGQGSGSPRYVNWSGDGAKIYFSKLDHMQFALNALDVRNGAITRLSPPGRVDFLFSFSRDGRRAAFLSSATDLPNEVRVADLFPFREKRITRGDAQLAGITMPFRSVLEWTGDDGLPIESLVLSPYSGKPPKPLPLFVLLEGTYGSFDLSFSTRAASDSDLMEPINPQLIAAQGFIVLMPNPRGSWGYGAEFYRKGLSDPVIGPNGDIMKGIQKLLDSQWVDRSRIAIAGSYIDGTRAYYAMSHSDLFKAGIIWNGFYNFDQMYATSPGFLNLLMGGSPWDHRAKYDAASPNRAAANYKTPTFFFVTGDVPCCLEPHRREAQNVLKQKSIATEVKEIPYEEFMALRRPWMDAAEKATNWLTQQLDVK